MPDRLAGHDKYQGMFMGSELGFSYRCKCGWTSLRYDTEGEAMEAAGQHEKDNDAIRNYGFARSVTTPIVLKKKRGK